MSLPASERSALSRSDAAMRAVRWGGAAFVLLQFALYHPPAGMALPFPRWPFAFAIATLLAAMNIAARALGTRLGARALARVGWLQWAADGAVVVALVWVFSFDSQSALWALLLIPVLEGALRLQLRGALLAWAVLGAAYVARDIWAARTYDHIAFLPESVSYRLGIVLLVAMTAGMLARELREQMEAHAAARTAAEHRADVLAIVAATGRSLSSGEQDILSSVADAAVRLGFDACEVCVLDEERDTYRVRTERGMPVPSPTVAQPATAGLAGIAMQRGEVVLVEDYARWTGGLERIRTAGFQMVVAVPMFEGGRVAGALAAGFTTDGRRPTSDEIDGLELLAAHAGAALEQQRRLTERERYETRLTHQAYHDALTGLANRGMLMARLDEAVLTARWEGNEVAVLFLDLDRFKTVNDSLGHDAGDQLLCAVADRLRARTRSGDVVARLGGDEFTVLCQGESVRGRAPRLARRLAEVLREPYDIDGRKVYLSASIGIAFGPVAGAAGTELLRRADLAMYRAKELGRDRVAMYRPDLADRLLRQLETETALRQALEREEFVLHYQPIVDLHGSRPVGMEALLRWRHDGRLLSPGEFLTAAEETGVIVPLGRWVLHEATRQHTRWKAALGWAPPVYVNVSAQQLRQPFFADEVSDALLASGVRPDELVLEITEGGVVHDEEGVACLHRLRGLGIRLALDDFGTGWSSLSRLRGVPVDVLKVDRSFIARLPEDPRSAAIVRNVVGLAAELGMTVTAEGIEDEAQRLETIRLGCSAGQGFLFARPMPADEAELLLAESTAGGIIPQGTSRTAPALPVLAGGDAGH